MPKDDDDYQKHIRERKEQPPEFLHKYVTMEIAWLILESGKMRFQSPIGYNDPFDSQWDPAWTLKTPEAHSIHKTLMREALHDKSCWPSGMNRNVRAALTIEYDRLQSLPLVKRAVAVTRTVSEVTDRQQIDQFVHEMLTDLRHRLRVLCLTETPNSVTMWAHYADEHKGIVLTFKSRDLEDGLVRPVERVRYKETPPKLVDARQWYKAAVYGLERPEWLETDNDLILTKAIDWKYEKEWRFAMIADKGTMGDHDDYPISGCSLVELTMGCRANRQAFRDLATLAQKWNPDIKLREAFVPLGSLQLEFKDLDPTTL